MGRAPCAPEAISSRMLRCDRGAEPVVGRVGLAGGDDGVIDADEFGAWSRPAGGRRARPGRSARSGRDGRGGPRSRRSRIEPAAPPRRSPRSRRASAPGGTTSAAVRPHPLAGPPPGQARRGSSGSHTGPSRPTSQRAGAAGGSGRRRRSPGASRRHRSAVPGGHEVARLCGAHSSRMWPPADGSSCCRCRARPSLARRAMGAIRPQRPQSLAGRGAAGEAQRPAIAASRPVTTRTLGHSSSRPRPAGGPGNARTSRRSPTRISSSPVRSQMAQAGTGRTEPRARSSPTRRATTGGAPPRSTPGPPPTPRPGPGPPPRLVIVASSAPACRLADSSGHAAATTATIVARRHTRHALSAPARGAAHGPRGSTSSGHQRLVDRHPGPPGPQLAHRPSRPAFGAPCSGPP